MTQTKTTHRVARTVAAVLTSILTGVSAGIVLARRPLVPAYVPRSR
jgi:ABC-type proline/glycine betaine transport system permease subunit